MKKILMVFGVSVVVWLSLQAAGAEQPTTDDEIKALRKEIETLKQEQLALRKELEELKKRPQQSAAPATTKAFESVDFMMDIKGEPTAGDANAKLVLVEFSEYQCPFCGRYATGTFPQIKKEFVDTGKLRYVFRDYPNEEHKQSFKAAEAARCAGE